MRMTPEKRTQRGKWIRGTASRGVQIPRRAGSGPAPLSFNQRRLWFLHELAPDSTAYNIASATRIHGRLNLDAVKSALNLIIERHELLRTTFQSIQGTPYQMIEPPFALDVPVTDLRHLPPADREHELQTAIDQGASTPFRLLERPLIRATVIRLNDEEYVLNIVIHHIVFDGASFAIFSNEFAEFYSAFSRGTRPKLRELSIQYADFAQWQHEHLLKKECGPHLAYWKKQLAGDLPVLELPADRGRPAVYSFRGASLTLVLGEEVGDGVRRLRRECGVTTFMVMFAAYNVWLSLRSGQTDLLVGCTVEGRNYRQLENLIGYFVNTLALRTDLSGEITFREALRRTRDVILDAHAHQDLPWEKLVQELRPERDLSSNPFFQIAFNFSKKTRTEGRPPADRKNSPVARQTTSKFDLWVSVVEDGDLYVCDMEYNTDLFSEATARQMLAQFEHTIQQVLDFPDCPIIKIPLLRKDEYIRSTALWNDTACAYGPFQPVHRLIEYQAGRLAGHPACIFEDKAWSYGELNVRANRIAHRLRNLGVGPDVIVGIAAERSLEMIAGLLGIMKAGGAYLPLEPAYPSERLKMMIQDSGVRIVLTSSPEFILSGEDISLLRIDELSSGKVCDQNPNVTVHGRNIAYVIYTSGSSGAPKACTNVHEAIFNRLAWMQQHYNLMFDDRVLQKTPFSFDVSVWEFFWPLMAGATLVIARPEGHKDPGYLMAEIARHRISTLHFVPSMLLAFMEAAEGVEMPSLKRVICSGEALPQSAATTFYSMFPQVELHNLYGPTEAAIDVTACLSESSSTGSTVPIGRPISNLRIYVLDRYLRPVSVGMRGELYIGGVGLARGYWKRPALTAQRFVSDPWSEAGDRLYRTGDLVRWLPDGKLEFINRIDEQVKIRGHRIELGEIETELRRHKYVQDALVMVDREGEHKRLIGYVVLADGNGDEARQPEDLELREHLRERLPEYMVPAAVIVMQSWPLTPHGKLDRKALPIPQRPSKIEYRAARTPTEAILCTLLQKMLRLERVGIDDNFFEIGGDSILTLKLMYLLKRSGVALKPLQLFKHPTIAELANAIESESASSDSDRGAAEPGTSSVSQAGLSLFDSSACYFGPEDNLIRAQEEVIRSHLPDLETIESIYPLASLPEDMLAQYADLGVSDINFVQNIIPADGKIIDLFAEAAEIVISRYAIMRTSFIWKGMRLPLQVVHKNASAPISFYDLRGYSADEQQRHVNQFLTEDAERGLELSVPAPMRWLWMLLDANRLQYILSYNYLHIDGWTLGIVTREIESVYEALAAKREIPKPETRPAYIDYIRWLLRQENADARAYWQAELRGWKFGFPLVDQMPGNARSEDKRFFCKGVTLSASVTEGVRSCAQRHRVSENIVFQAGWALMLAAYTGKNDVLFGLASTGKTINYPDIVSMAGYTLNYLPLRIRIRPDELFSDCLRQLQRKQIELMQWETLPLRKLRDWCALPGTEPVFDTLYYYQALNGITSQPSHHFYTKTAYPLRLDIFPHTADIGTEIFSSYHRQYFRDESMVKALNDYRDLMARIAADPNQRMGELIRSIPL